MVRRGALERYETGANHLEARGKRKPVTLENDPRETGLSFVNGGGGGSRTRVRKYSTAVSTYVSFVLSFALCNAQRQALLIAIPCEFRPVPHRKRLGLSCLK